jgi:hypothetical protein
MWEAFCLMQLAYLLEFSFLFCSSDLKYYPGGMEVWKHTGRSTMHRTKEYEATYGLSQSNKA